MSSTPTLDGPDAWRAAVHAGSFGVWDLRPPQEAVHYSPRWKQRLGFPQAQAADHTAFWRCRVHPDDLEAMLRTMQNHLDGFTPTYETRFRLRSNGSGYRMVLSRGRVVLRDQAGEVVRVVGTMVDLTQRPTSPLSPAWDTDEPASSGPFIEQPFHELLSRREAAGDQAQLLASVADLLDSATRESLQRA